MTIVCWRNHCLKPQAASPGRWREELLLVWEAGETGMGCDLWSPDFG